MPDIFGHVDARGRPIVSLPVPDEGDEFLVVVDTGFNGALLLHDGEFSRRKCEVSTHLQEMVEFADGERRALLLGRMNISWFGRPLAVDVLISQSERSRAVVADEPIGLLGTALLSQHRLTIDFAAHRVVITE